MKLSIGIVGMPNVGKSTLFKTLTRQEVTVANYPFATIDPNVGVVPVPDERVDTLAAMSKSKKKIPAIVEFYDIAGLVRGANKGEGLGNQFLAAIRNVAAIAHVVRVFGENNIAHVEGVIDPLRDIDIIEMELVFKDLETIEKALRKMEGEARTGDKRAIADLEAVRKAKTALEAGELLSAPKHSAILQNVRISEFQLLTAKPQLFLLNGKEEEVTGEVKKKIEAMGFEYLVVDLRNAESVPELIKKAYAVLNLISFFTTGEDETRAWTIERGTKAPEAAGVIHTDFQKKFIRAEVVSYDDFVAAGGWFQAKQKGKLRVEGKGYEVRDGDIIEVRHG